MPGRAALRPAMTRVTQPRPGAELVGDDVGVGPALLLLHAGGEDRTVWARIAERLVHSDLRSVAYDLRGHGGSGATDAHRLPVLSDDVAALLGTFAVPPLLVGASIGGLAALHAIADPAVQDRCAGLVLVDVVPAPSRDAVRAYLGPRGLADHPLVDDVLGRAAELEAAASGLRLPVRLICGGRDSPVSDMAIAQLAAHTPALRVDKIPEAGHLVARDAPDRLADLLIAAAGADDIRGRRIAALVRAGGADEIDHPGGTLSDHLERTGMTLLGWDAEAWAIDAGRLHAAYGTEGFPHPLPGATPQAVTAAVGAHSERLIDLYCHCRRTESYPTLLGPNPSVIDRRTAARRPLDSTRLRAFCELTVANEMDVLAHAPELRDRHARALATLFGSWRPIVGPQARAAIDHWLRSKGPAR